MPIYIYIYNLFYERKKNPNKQETKLRFTWLIFWLNSSENADKIQFMNILWFIDNGSPEDRRHETQCGSFLSNFIPFNNWNGVIFLYLLKISMYLIDYKCFLCWILYIISGLFTNIYIYIYIYIVWVVTLFLLLYTPLISLFLFISNTFLFYISLDFYNLIQ